MECAERTQRAIRIVIELFSKIRFSRIAVNTIFQKQNKQNNNATPLALQQCFVPFSIVQLFCNLVSFFFWIAEHSYIIPTHARFFRVFLEYSIRLKITENILFPQIALFALFAMAAAAPSPQYYAAPVSAPLYQNYYGSPYAQPLLAKYAPAPQAPASTEHATHVAAAVAPLTYSYYPAYAYAPADAVSPPNQ